MPSAHSEFPPSGMERLIACPASWSRSKGAVRKESKVMRDGTITHAVVENKAYGRAPSDWVLPKGVKHRDITPEMVTAAEQAIEVYDLLRAVDWPFDEGIEERVTLAGWGLPKIWGTADYVHRRPFDRLIIADYKHGEGVPVDPDSAQLFTYALGAAGSPEELRTYGEVETIIIQPRCKQRSEPVRHHVMPAGQLYEWYHDILMPGIVDATSPSPTVRPSTDACRWCEARNLGRCPEYHQQATGVAKLEFASLIEAEPIKPIVPEDPEQLGRIYTQLPLLKSWITFIEKKAAEATMAGKPTGLKYVAGRKTRVLKDEAGALALLKGEYEFEEDDLYTERKVLGPAALESLIPKGKAVLAPFVESLPGKPALVPGTDPRPAITMAQADFASLIPED